MKIINYNGIHYKLAIFDGSNHEEIYDIMKLEREDKPNKIIIGGVEICIGDCCIKNYIVEHGSSSLGVIKKSELKNQFKKGTAYKLIDAVYE